MQRMYLKLSQTVIVVMLVLIAGVTFLYIFPWYSYGNNGVFKTTKEEYFPGEDVRIVIERNSYIDVAAVATRELVRVDKVTGIYHEVCKVTFGVSIDKGRKTVESQYKLPFECRDKCAWNDKMYCVSYDYNTYVWSGSLVYRPFGLVERTLRWTTTPFKILPDETCKGED